LVEANPNIAVMADFNDFQSLTSNSAGVGACRVLFWPGPSATRASRFPTSVVEAKERRRPD
jgi:hypothetical protein